MCECVDYYDERYGASRYLCEVCFAEYEEIKAERDRLRTAIIRQSENCPACGPENPGRRIAHVPVKGPFVYEPCDYCGIAWAALEGGDDE